MKITDKKTRESILKNPTLDDILVAVNDWTPDYFILDKPQVSKDGSVNGLTKKGSEVYKTLVDILYAVSQLTCTDSIDEAVETMDRICVSEE
jgi:hypothetical protein